MIHPDIHQLCALEDENRRFYSAMLYLHREMTAGSLPAVPDDATDWLEHFKALPFAEHARFVGVAGLLLQKGHDDPANGGVDDVEEPGDVFVSVLTSRRVTFGTAKQYRKDSSKDAARVVPAFALQFEDALSRFENARPYFEKVLRLLAGSESVEAKWLAEVVEKVRGIPIESTVLTDFVREEADGAGISTPPHSGAEVNPDPAPSLPETNPVDNPDSPAPTETINMCKYLDLNDNSGGSTIRLYASVRHLLGSEFGFSVPIPVKPDDLATMLPDDRDRAYFLGVFGLMRLDGIDDPSAGGLVDRASAGDVHLRITADSNGIQNIEKVTNLEATIDNILAGIDRSKLENGQLVRNLLDAQLVRIVPSFKANFIHAVQEYVSNKNLFMAAIPHIITASTPTGGDAAFKTVDLAGVTRRLIENETSPSSPQLRLMVHEAFSQLLGGRIDGRAASIPIDLPNLDDESNESLIGDNIEGLSALYYCAMLEQMKFFAVAEKVSELFMSGAIPVSRGPAGQDLYEYIREEPNRFSQVERRSLYGRSFGLAMGSVDVSAPNREFADLWVRFLSSASYHRRQVQFERTQVTSQTVAKSAQDLAVNLSLHGYGVGYFAAVELQRLVIQIMDMLARPEVLSAFGATTRWQLVERVSEMYLGGAVNGVKHRTMATTGMEIIKWLGAHAKQLGPKTWDNSAQYSELYEHIDRWLAVTGTPDQIVERHAAPVSTNSQPTIPSWSFSGTPSLNDAFQQLDAVIPEAK